MNHRYHVEGDWIPAADCGGDLLRFYGHPYAGIRSLVSVATLYNTCDRDCVGSRTYALSNISFWTLPGTKARSMHPVLQ